MASQKTMMNGDDISYQTIKRHGEKGFSQQFVSDELKYQMLKSRTIQWEAHTRDFTKLGKQKLGQIIDIILPGYELKFKGTLTKILQDTHGKVIFKSNDSNITFLKTVIEYCKIKYSTKSFQKCEICGFTKAVESEELRHYPKEWIIIIDGDNEMHICGDCAGEIMGYADKLKRDHENEK